MVSISDPLVLNKTDFNTSRLTNIKYDNVTVCSIKEFKAQTNFEFSTLVKKFNMNKSGIVKPNWNKIKNK